MEAGTLREVRVAGGVIRYREFGTGPALVFVHATLANGTLWRDVVAWLSGRFRCMVPDLPLGGRSIPMRREADMSPAGAARMVAGFMERLDLRDVTLVGTDPGGATCQGVISHNPERVGRLILTNSGAYEAFFPPFLRSIQYAARLFGTRFVDLFAWALRARLAQRVLFKIVAIRHIDDPTLDAYMAPLLQEQGVRGDLAGFFARSPGGIRSRPRGASRVSIRRS